jgi:TonB family protein
MRRVRREVVALPAGAGGRMVWALALSVVLHASAILGIGGRAGRAPAPKAAVLTARLVALPAAPSPVQHSASPRVPVPVVAPGAGASAAAVEPPPPTVAPEVSPPIPAPIELPADELPDSTHYAAGELDVYPSLGARLAPAYPSSALGERLPGKVTLQVLIDERGRVTAASVVDAAPAGVFDESAREAFLHAAFSPAQRGGRAVRSRILVHVEFDPDKP